MGKTSEGAPLPTQHPLEQALKTDIIAFIQQKIDKLHVERQLLEARVRELADLRDALLHR